ncbi:signal recognition particle protein [Xylariales sp. AK1849]|nr:signal recognition particle protein [Xylariales sp. AK1849]
MDITSFVVASRNQALLYGDYSTYHKQLVKKLLSCRKKLNISIKNRGKFTKKGDPRDITSEQIAENHAYLHLGLLTAERAWAQAMELKATHSADTNGITGRSRSHIISRLDKGARTAERLVEVLSNNASGASPTDLLEARAYASLMRGAEKFEKQSKQSWESCLRNYSTARIIYVALSLTRNPDTFKDLLSETIDPSIRYAAYQIKEPRTLAIPAIAKKYFPSDSSLTTQINERDSSLLKQTAAEAKEGQVGSPSAPQTINWRSREVKIEDATIALALASTDAATAQLAEKLASPEVILPKEMAAAYDGVLIASQDAADATKHAIDELKEEGVSQNDRRVQSLHITRTAVNYQMISWRIGRNRVLSGDHDGALLDSAPNTTRKAKKETEKEAGAKNSKTEPTGRKIARLKEKLVLYDATLQSLQSIKELPGVAADEDLQEQLDATYQYFHALKCLSIARSHSLAGNSINALALTKCAFDDSQESATFFSKQMSTSSDGSPLNIEIRDSDTQFLTSLLKGELQRCRALVEIDNLQAKSHGAVTKSTVPLVQRLHEYPADGVHLDNLVTYPPKVEPIPVKPLFFDVAWNYIDYPGKAPVATAKAENSKGDTTAPAQKKGWFGFGRG